MKKSKHIALMIIVGMFCIGSLSVFASIAENSTAEFSTYLKTQDKSNLIYNNLLLAFTENGKYALEEHYPNYYAGAFINEQGILVILTKGATAEDIKTIEQVCGKQGYIIKTANYSINELITTKNAILQKVGQAREQKVRNSDIIHLSIRDNYNKVFIGVPDISDCRDFVSYITEKTDKTLFEVYETAELKDFTSFYPGDFIHASEGGSAGYKVRMRHNGENKIGFITAAHVTEGVDAYTGRVHWVKIGDTIVEHNGGSVDAAFVEMASGQTFVNEVEGQKLASNISVIPAINSLVYKKGSQSYITQGYVISNLNNTTWSINGEDVEYTNLCETTVPCVEGDSGGLMYSVSGNEYRVVGNIKGGNDEYFYATKHSNLPWDVIIIE